jgi:hypothetical protein
LPVGRGTDGERTTNLRALGVADIGFRSGSLWPEHAGQRCPGAETAGRILTRAWVFGCENQR